MAEPFYIIIAEDQSKLGMWLWNFIKTIYPSANISLVTNGQEVLQTYAQTPADLIITDKTMPVMDGLELTQALRTKGIAVPVIILSFDAHLERQDKQLGATLFVDKRRVVSELPRVLPRLLPTPKKFPKRVVFPEYWQNNNVTTFK